MSQDLQWRIIRNNSCFLVKKKNIKRYFSTDPLNLKNIHSPRYVGLINQKAIGIEAIPGGKGVELLIKRKSTQKKPAKNIHKVSLTKGARRTMTSIKHILNSTNYRKDLKKLALRRASALLKGQRPPPPKKGAVKKTE